MRHIKWAFSLVAAGGLLMGAASQSHAAIAADIGGDWVDANTLPAGWQYLESTAANGGAESALSGGTAVGNGNNTGFGGSSNSFNLSAVLGEQNGGAQFEVFGDGFEGAGIGGNQGVVGTDLIVHPGDDTNLGGDGVDFVILRYTVSAGDVSGGNSATIAGSFRNMISTSGDSVSAFVYHNNAQLFAVNGNDAGGSDGLIGALSQADGTFNVNATVAAGDTIDFVVGINAALFADETAVRGTIDIVPEPASIALIGLGGLLVLRRR